MLNVLASRRARLLSLAALVAVLWTIYLLPWPEPWFLETSKPTVIAIAFALLAQRFRVGSWPVVIAFCLSFFLHSVVEAYFSDVSEASADQRVLMTALVTVLYSPISLWGPMALGGIAFYFARKLWPATRA